MEILAGICIILAAVLIELQRRKEKETDIVLEVLTTEIKLNEKSINSLEAKNERLESKIRYLETRFGGEISQFEVAKTTIIKDKDAE